MKRTLLILSALTFVLSSSAQEAHRSQMNARSYADEPMLNPNPRPAETVERLPTPELSPVGSASNMWTILNPDQSQVDYDPDLDVLSFVHRQDIGEHDEGGSGTVRFDLSNDQGSSWMIDQGPLTPELVSTGAAVPVITLAGDDIITGCRYPNGIIYNPPGNTDLDNAYYVSTGPCLFATLGDDTGWGISYYSSQRLDGSAAEDQYFIHMEDSVAGASDFFPTSLSQGGDAVFAVSDNGTGEIITIWKGSPNTDGTAFEWSPTDVSPSWKTNPDETIIYSGYQNLAFSADGSVGYFVLGGAMDDQVNEFYIPNVFTTTDGGATWELAAADLDIAATEAGTLLNGLAYTRRMDCVVDAYNQLHVFCEIMQSSEDNQSFFYDGYMVDFVWDGNEWIENIIGQIDDLEAGELAGAGSFQNQYTQPQASISPDGLTAAFTWTSSLESDVNDLPDIFGRAVDVVGGTMTEIKQLTEDTDAEGFAYYPTASSTMIDDGDDMDLEIPIVLFIDWSGNNLDPVQFYYLKGAGFDFDEFVTSVDEYSPLNGLMLYPNPANDVARLTFGIEEVMDAEIRIVDVLGKVQQLIANPALIAGQNNFNLDVSALANGVYTVEIIAGDSSSTLSLKVQH